VVDGVWDADYAVVQLGKIGRCSHGGEIWPLFAPSDLHVCEAAFSP